ncbi:phage tail spike protein [Enterococcus gallinarum]|uniref:phage tail spike protein n=2 Tax=Enterococcus gallinarum TaxID=1353 RepID=UPI0020514F8C|nr:MAG TPA: tail protein [Caudoviricetes sp.]
MTYPILYEANEIDFFSLGLGPIKTATEAFVTEERNGTFIFEAKVLVDDEIYPLLQENRIIKADSSPTLTDQRFRIKRIVPNHDGQAKIYAEHVSYLSQELPMKPEVFISGNASAALNAWKLAILDNNPFIVDSDIDTSNKTNWRIDKVENPRQALGGVEGSILDVWGGEYRFDNYHISLLKKRGTTANTILAYGRNITDFEQERNIMTTYTTIYPYAIYTDDDENEQIVTIDGYVVDCENINEYPNRNVLPVDFSNKFEHDEVPTKVKLKQLAQDYIKDNDIGIPKTSIKVSFLDLAQTADYADIATLETVELCDDVRVYYEKLGVDTTAKVIKTKWNVLRDAYDEIEIGEKRTTLSSIINDTQTSIKEIGNQMDSAITAANGKNMIFHGLFGKNGEGEPTATRVGDMWYKPSGEDIEFYIWDGTVWTFIMSTAKFDEIANKVSEVESDTKRAVEKANNIQINVNHLVSDISAMNRDISTISFKASEAYSKVRSVEGKTVSIEKSVDGLKGRITTVETTSTSTTKKLNELEITVDGQKQTLATMQTTANSALSKANVLQTTVDGVTQTLASVEQWQNNFQVGGRNWVSESESPKFRPYQGASITHSIVQVPEWNAKNAVRHVVTGGTGTICGTLPGNIITYVKNNTSYVHSIYVKNNGDKRIRFSNNLGKTDYVEPGQSKRISLVAKHLENLAAMQFVLYRSTNADSLDFTVWRAQIEEGNQLTDWSPAPEDKAQTTKVNEIETTVDGVKTTVTSVKTTADSALSKATQTETTVSGLKTTISSVQTTANSALTKATQLETTANVIRQTVTEIQGNITDITNKFPNPNFKKQEPKPAVEGTGIHIVYDSQGMTINNNGGATRNRAYWGSPPLSLEIGKTYNIKMYVNVGVNSGRKPIEVGTSDGENFTFSLPNTNPGWIYGTIKLTRWTGLSFWLPPATTIKIRQLYIYEANTNITSSQITQLSDTINLKVSKNDVVNQINISNESILIAGNKIHITGQTSIDNGVIKTAQIADLSVSTAKIANAAITDAKIAFVDAAKITTGYLSAQRIQARSITADKLAVNAIQVGFNNYSQNLKIDPYTLSFFNKNQLSGKLTSEGMEFWHGTRKIGRIGENSKIGNETIRGIAMNLDHEGDYISWSYRKAQNDSAFTSMLMLDPRGKFSGKAGIHMDADVHMIKVKPGIPSAREFLRFGVVNYNNTFYSALLNDSGKSGVMFGSGYLYLLHNNVVLPVEDIRNIVRALKGLGTLQLPTSIRTSGQGSGTVASFKTVKL